MEKIELSVTTRGIQGKKVRFLRRQGITPVHLIGRNIESLALQCDTAQLKHTMAQAGMTQLINLKIDKARKPRSVMVKEVQKDIMTGNLMHVDFYQVTMTEKISLELPIVLVGEAPAEKSSNNMLVHELSSLAIEAFPGAIPENVEVDISSLNDTGQVIRVGDIKVGEEITVSTDPEHVVVRVTTRPTAKVEEVSEEGEVIVSQEAPPVEEQQQEE